jgi:hypothetical protein
VPLLNDVDSTELRRRMHEARMYHMSGHNEELRNALSEIDFLLYSRAVTRAPVFDENIERTRTEVEARRAAEDLHGCPITAPEERRMREVFWVAPEDGREPERIVGWDSLVRRLQDKEPYLRILFSQGRGEIRRPDQYHRGLPSTVTRSGEYSSAPLLAIIQYRKALRADRSGDWVSSDLIDQFADGPSAKDPAPAPKKTARKTARY